MIGDAPDSVEVRFFTPKLEVPICGHATVATHAIRSLESGVPQGTTTQVSPGGRWEISWNREGDVSRVTMRQQPVRLVGEAANRYEIAAALGIGDDVLASDWPVEVWSTGSDKILVPVATADGLAGIVPDMDALRTLSEPWGGAGFFVFTLDTTEPGFLTECRMFGPAVGVPEDPVNGSGHGPLAGYLWARRALPASGRFLSRMGRTMDRPGVVEVAAVMGEEEPIAVDVTGAAVIVFSTEFEV